MNPVSVFFSGGPIMYPLLLIAISAIYFTINRYMSFYGNEGNVAKGLLPEVLDLVKEGREGDALARSEQVPGPVAACITTILRYRHQPVEDVERQVEATSEEYYNKLERFLPALDTFTTLSPLLGLLGTILGMVKVFQQFTAAAGDEGAKAKILAGVGESLYATAFGISIAVFCFFVYNVFTARQRSITTETQLAANKLIAQIHERSAARH